MLDTTIRCPACQTEIPLTETLARPLIEAERKNLEREMRDRASALASRQQELQKQETQLVAAQKTLADRLIQERNAIAKAEAEKAEASFRIHLDGMRKNNEALSAKVTKLQQTEIQYLNERAALAEEKRQLHISLTRQLESEREKIRTQAILDQNELHQFELSAKETSISDLKLKLLEAHKVEADIRKQRETLESEKQALELEITRRLDQERQKVREATQREEDERHHLKIAEKEKIIDDMRRQIEEMRRMSEQGSQQLQGEVQELELENILKLEFPRDEIDAVPVGRSGSDLIHKVIGPQGLVCGTIIWEAKRTKAWNNAWLTKNREDQRAAGAHLGVIVTAILPNGVRGFERKEGVWVVGFPYFLALGRGLRLFIIEAALAKITGEDREGKANRLYSYVTSQEFKQRVSAVVEAYAHLRDELEVEKRFHKIRWARQERSLDLLQDGVGMMYGSLQGVVGKAMPEVDGLKIPQLEPAPDLDHARNGKSISDSQQPQLSLAL